MAAPVSSSFRNFRLAKDNREQRPPAQLVGAAATSKPNYGGAPNQAMLPY